MLTGASKGLRPAHLLGAAAVLGLVLGVVIERGRTAMQSQTEPADPLSPAHLPRAPRGAPPPGSPLPSLALEGLPPYPNASPKNLAEGVRSQGAPVHIAWFQTEDDPEQVLRFYEEQLLANGYPVVSHRYSPYAGYAGYFNPGTKTLHLVSVLWQHGKTLVFPSASHPGALLPVKGPLPENVPAPEGALGSAVYAFEEGGRTQTSVFTTVPHASVKEVADHYAQALSQRGWRVEPARVGERGAMRLEARRANVSASIWIRNLSSSEHPPAGAAVYMTLAKGA
ncbi:MAG: hypothetical protein ACOZIN_20005 [Myxococcota bacterium]